MHIDLGPDPPAAVPHRAQPPLDQRDVIAWLGTRAAYGTTDTVERIDTHSSVVFLVGGRAYKLKRGVSPVNRAPDGSLSFNGWGRTVEWLVEMARFDQDMQVDRLATCGALELGLMLADVRWPAWSSRAPHMTRVRSELKGGSLEPG